MYVNGNFHQVESAGVLIHPKAFWRNVKAGNSFTILMLLWTQLNFRSLCGHIFKRSDSRISSPTTQSCKTILDVGGGRQTWKVAGAFLRRHDSEHFAAGGHWRFHLCSGIACDIPFPDKSFDLAFSNSAIEHVGSEENQFKFAREMMRVGKRIYCQTPSRLFPIDPHLTAPFLHWLPNSLVDAPVSALFHIEWMVIEKALSI